MAANNDLGSLSYSLNIDISQLPNTIRDVERQLSTINMVANTDIRTDPTQLIDTIKRALMAEDFKLKVSIDDSFKDAISNATSLLNSAANGAGGTNNTQLGYIDTLIQKLKDLEAQYKALPKGANTSDLVQEFASVQAELDKVGKNLSTAFGKSWDEISKMAESTIGDLKSKIKSLEQYKLHIPLTDPAELIRVSDLINKLKGDISALFQTQNVNPFQMPEDSIKEIEAKIKALREVHTFSPINSKEFIDADKAMQQLRDKLKSLGNLSIADAFKLPESSLEEIRRKLKEIETIKIKSPVSSQSFMDATKELERLKKLLSDINNPAKASRTFAEVMGMDTNSLNQILAKLYEIRKLRGGVDVNSPNGMAQINSLNKAEADLLRLQQQRLGVNKNINETYATQSGLVDSLTSKALAFFSLEKMQQFATKLIDIRGEFEKQQVALQTILQSKDQADKLFSQVVELGLKSPFSIMQLNSYVKGLAAYRIETDQLFDTTKRLADISSGLGVDMSRLVLAYGQVRAASVLRGQEVRQFTEAGIPLIEALADKFTILEGRVVDTNEVFDKISNRLVPFQMVKDVLFEMTDAGGVFFNMQAKQAETLAGKWSNLKDAIDVMYNSIGQDNEGFLKGMAEGLTTMTENWREILDLATASIAALGVMKTLSFGRKILDIGAVMNQGLSLKDANDYASKLANSTDLIAIRTQNVGRQWQGVGKIFNQFGRSVGAFAAANWPMLLIGAIAAIGAKIYTTYQESKRFGEELAAIGIEGVKGAKAVVEVHEELVAKLKETTEGTIARREAIDKLNSQFGAYYSNTLTDINAQQMLASEYDRVNAKIKENAKLKSEEDVKAKIQERYGKERDSLEAKIYAEASEGKGAIDKKQLKVLLDNIAKKSKLENTTDSFDLLKIATDVGKEFGLDKDQIKKLRSQMGGVNAFGYTEGITSLLRKDAEIVSALNDGLNDVRIKYSEIMPDATKSKIEAFDEELELIEAKLKKRKELAGGLDSEKKGSYEKEINDAEIEALKEKIVLANEFNWISKKNEFSNQLKQISVNVGQIQKASEKLFGLDSNAFTGLRQINSLGAMQGEYKRLTESLKNPKLYNPDKDKEGLTNLDKDKTKLENLKKLAKELDIDLDPKTSTKEGRQAEDARIAKYKAEIALVKEANSAYKKYREVLDETNAKSEVDSNFASQFQELGVDIKYASKELEFYQSLTSKLSSGTSKKDVALWNSVNKEIGGTQSEDEIEKLKKQWDELNDLFDLKKDAYTLRDMYMQKGVSKDIAESFVKQIYGDIPIEFDNFQDEVSAKLATATGNWGAEAGTAFRKRFGQEAKNSFLEMLDKFQTVQQKIDGINFKYAQIFKDLESQKGEVSEEVYAGMVANAQTAKAEELAAVTATAIQMTEAYQKMFGNIADMSEKELNYIIQKWKTALSGASRNMDGTFSITIDGKQFTTTEQQIASFTKKVLASEKELRAKNPFKALHDSIEELKKNSLLKGKLEEELSQLKTERSISTNEVDTDRLDKEIVGVEDSLKGLDAQNATTWGNMSSQIDLLVGQVTGLANSFIALFEAFGADEDLTETLNDIVGLIGGIGDAASGAARIANGDVLGGLTQSVKGLASVVSSITSLSDRKHERQIKRLQKAIDDSKIAYEQLGRAASKALGNVEYDTKKLQIAELKRQQELIKGQIRAENDKKKTDKGKIKDWEEEYRQLGYEIEDIITDITESLTGNIKDMASDITNALVEAFEAGDNAQEAMFKAIKNNLKATISKQFQKTVVEGALKPLFDRMNDMLGIDDTGNATYKKFTPEQVKELIGMAGGISEDVMDIFNSGGWKEIFDALTNSGELSGLSKGIQGLTEDTAQILEAYLNTIRDVMIAMKVTQDNQLMILQTSQMIHSQTLVEVASINSNVVAIALAIKSVIAQSNGDNGAGFRVYVK